MLDVMLSISTAVLSYLAVIFLVDQQAYRPKPYKVIWAIGLFVYGTAGLVQFFGTAGHWTLTEYRIWYLTGAILAAPYLGMGTLYLLGPRKWADRLMLVVGAFSVYAFFRTLTATLTPRTNWLPAGETLPHWFASASNAAVVNVSAHPIMPNDIVFVIIVLNSLGALALVGGAGWSAWKFWHTRQNSSRFLSMILLMIGGLAPTSAGSLTKMGVSSAFYILTFAGALFLCAGYLVSIDVFAMLRVPFTNTILLDRSASILTANASAATGQDTPSTLKNNGSEQDPQIRSKHIVLPSRRRK